MSSDQSAADNPDRSRLREHFIGQESNANRWDDLWADGNFLPWDRHAPNPALADALTDRKDLFGSSPLLPDGKRKRAFVPGCGKGYDVLLLASFGYDAIGLESENAVKAAIQWQKDHEAEYEVRDAEVGRGSVTFVTGNFFEQAWEKDIPGGIGDGFDVIYDYTFLCALPPPVRPKWAVRQSQLLHKSRGNLVCLEFPTYKPPSSGGPPWALYPAVYEQLLPQPGVEPQYNEEGYIIEEKREIGENGLVRVAHWQPERTHPIGKGTDWVGVWRHKAFASGL